MTVVPRARAWQPELGGGAALLLAAPLAAALLTAFLGPLVWLLWVSVADPELGAGNYADLVSRGAARRAFENTGVISALVTAASLLIGGFLAWELRNARSRLYRALLWATLLFPLWTSVIIRNYALTMLLSRKGTVNDVLLALGVADEPVPILYTDLAVLIGMTHSMIPYAALPLYAAFVLIDDDLVHAARSLGASRARAFASVVLPLALPSVAATATLVFVVSVGFYVTPTVLGGPQNLFVATLVDAQVNQLFDVPGAAAASFLLLAGGIGLVALATALVGWRRFERVLA